ncbi:uncharacterized protein LOC122505265 [Leptopilina heterotoma]|uniref:uncharacterized protein LOC122505265 n=1 Tax=Leptopilina heterotoma TaxID=63436 RepID=UPI001CA821C6|nr:uncharacterized protein LOC122505265 [Leptopilina heterotoma]
MIGSEKGFFHYFSELVPRAQLIKCTCHSIHLCGSKAAEQLPADLEFLVRESRNWFSKSALRRSQYEALYTVINDGDMPKNLVQLSATRWLAWGRAIAVIVSQWLELKTHFDNHVRSINPSEKCTIGRKLRDLFQDECNLLYLLFLKPVTAELCKTNLKFQQDSTEVTKLFVDLRVLLISFVIRIIKPEYIKINQNGQFLSGQDFQDLKSALDSPHAYLPLNAIDFGASFAIHLGRINLPMEKIREVKQRCLNYLSILCKELVYRLPNNMHHFENIRYFTPEESLKPVNRVDFFKLPLQLADPNVDLDFLQTQWDQLILVDLRNHFNGKIPVDSVEFWSGIFEYRDSAGQTVFTDLASFALRILCLPFSNASIERVFSIMNSVKTKARNKLSIVLLMAIMRIRLRFGTMQECCNTFEPTARMFQLFTSQMYVSLNEASNRNNNNHDEISYFETLELFADENNLL